MQKLALEQSENLYLGKDVKQINPTKKIARNIAKKIIS